MSDTLLCLIPTSSDGQLDRHSLECLNAAKALKEATSAKLVVGCWGIKPVQSIGACGADQYILIEGDEFTSPRYATDAAAAEDLIKAAEASIVIAPASSRVQRFISGLATRLGGQVDTHVTQIDAAEGELIVTRWYYRQRMEAKIKRASKGPWLISLESGCYDSLEPGTDAAFETVVIASLETRTTVKSIESTASGDQTIRPDSDLLFVAGAGWTKKQSDGSVQIEKAGSLILDFIHKRKASLGSSKSMVDLSSEGQAVLSFLTHMHQVGQTGSTPRHTKGLATCCHGEEPHAVGWRFIQERRAINMDGNCGWAHGKADVLYVADAFEVMARVNALI